MVYPWIEGSPSSNGSEQVSTGIGLGPLSIYGMHPVIETILPDLLNK
jgi:hypothetical protein